MTITLATDKVSLFYQPARSRYAVTPTPEPEPTPEVETETPTMAS